MFSNAGRPYIDWWQQTPGMIAMSSNVTKADFAVIAEDPLGLRNKVIYSHKGEK